VAVIMVGDAGSLRRCLSRLVPQISGKPIEVLVPFDNTVEDLGGLRREFPELTFLDLGKVRTVARPGTVEAQHELFDKRISAVFAAGRGEKMALLQDWGAPAADWCERLIEAESLPYAAVGGAVENEGQGVLNWAVYFLDFGRHQLPLVEGPVRFLSDVNIVYSRQALEAVRGLWERRYNEVIVNWALAARGEVLWRKPSMVVYQDRGRLSLSALVRERLSWGKIFGAARAHELSLARLLPYILLSPLIPCVIALRVARKVLSGRRNRRVFLRAFPAFFLLTVFWSLGELWGYLSRKPSPLGEDSG